MASLTAACFFPIWTQHSMNKHRKGTYRTKVLEAGGIHTSLYTQGNLGLVTEESGPSPSHPTATGPEPEPRRLPRAPSQETW